MTISNKQQGGGGSHQPVFLWMVIPPLMTGIFLMGKEILFNGYASWKPEKKQPDSHPQS